MPTWTLPGRTAAEDLLDHAKSAIAAHFGEGDRAGEDLAASVEIMRLASGQVDSWVRECYILTAEGVWVDAHAFERGLRRQTNEGDSSLQDRTRAPEDAVSPLALDEVIERLLDNAGVAGSYASIELADCAFLGSSDMTEAEAEHFGFLYDHTAAPDGFAQHIGSQQPAFLYQLPAGTPDQTAAAISDALRTKRAAGVYHRVEWSENVAPVAGFTVAVDGLTAEATDTSTDDGSIVARSMDWGDGTPAEDLVGAGPWTHDYAALGTYHPTMTVTDDGGLTDDVTVEVTTVFEYPVDGADVAAKMGVAAAPTAYWRHDSITPPVADLANSYDITAVSGYTLETDATIEAVMQTDGDGGAATATAPDDPGLDAGNGSIAVLQIGRVLSQPAGVRGLVAKRDPVWPFPGWEVQLSTSGGVTSIRAVVSGADALEVIFAFEGETYYACLLARDVTAGRADLFTTEGSSSDAPIAASSLDNAVALAIGANSLRTAPDARFGMTAIWIGAGAEGMAQDHLDQLLTRMGLT